MFNIFRPYKNKGESVRKFRQVIFVGIEIDAQSYEAQVQLGTKPEDLPDVQCRAFKLLNEMNAAQDAFEKASQATKERAVKVCSENEHVEELLGLRGGAVTPSPRNVVADAAAAANPALLLGKQPGESNLFVFLLCEVGTNCYVVLCFYERAGSKTGSKTTVLQGQIDHSNSERASAAAAAAGVSVTKHAVGIKKVKRNVDTQSMMDQLVLNFGSGDKELVEALKMSAAPSAPVESPDTKRSRKSSNLSEEIKRLMEEKSRESDPVEIEKLSKKIARKRKQRAKIDGDSEEDDE